MPPKLCRSCSSFLTSMISGKSAMPFTKGYSTGVPMHRANAMNCAGASAWARKKMTRCSRKARRSAVADPGAYVVAGNVRRFRQSRYLGHAGGAPRERDAIGLEPARLHVTHHRGDGLEGVVHAAVHHVGEGGRASFVGHVAGL